MNVTVRRAERADAETLLSLIEALAHFEELAPPDDDARERLIHDGWPEQGRQPRFSAWLAEVSDSNSDVMRAVGYAITFFTYSSFLARPTLYIEDIFLLPEYRRGGIGSVLMRRLMQEALDNDCGRMEWVVLDWNTGAQRFYQRWDASHLTEWQYYRLRAEEMRARLAE